MKKLVTELQYLGTVSHYILLTRHQNILFDAHEHFEKSTYRNRCYIASPNGKLRLTVPVEGGKGQRARYAGLRIDAETNWQKIHWQSLTSCYRNSPYFEYYEDRFEPFYHEQFENLFDFNKQLMELILELLGIELNIAYTTGYQKKYDDAEDFRSKIIPSVQQETDVKYRQVFEEKTGFLQDLSIVDLLFSEGPHAREKLINSVTVF